VPRKKKKARRIGEKKGGNDCDDLGGNKPMLSMGFLKRASMGQGVRNNCGRVQGWGGKRPRERTEAKKRREKISSKKKKEKPLHVRTSIKMAQVERGEKSALGKEGKRVKPPSSRPRRPIVRACAKLMRDESAKGGEYWEKKKKKQVLEPNRKERSGKEGTDASQQPKGSRIDEEKYRRRSLLKKRSIVSERR